VRGHISQIKDQEREVEAVFAAALRKLVQKGSVRHPSGEPNIQGPGCIVQAKVRGLEKIVKDERILQIVALPNERR